MTIYLTTQQIQEILKNPLFTQGIKLVLSKEYYYTATDITCEIGITKDSLSMLEETGLYIGDGFELKLDNK